MSSLHTHPESSHKYPRLPCDAHTYRNYTTITFNMASHSATLKPVFITIGVVVAGFLLMVVLPLLYVFRRSLWKPTKRFFTHGTCKSPDAEQGQGMELRSFSAPQLDHFAWEVRPELPTRAAGHAGGVHVPDRAHVRQVPASPAPVVPARPQGVVLPKTFMDKVAERTVPVPNHIVYVKQFVGRNVPNALDPSVPPRTTTSRFVEWL